MRQLLLALWLFCCVLQSVAIAQTSKVLAVWQSTGRLSSPVAVSNVSATTPLPVSNGSVAWVCNASAQDVYLAFGTSSITVTATTGSWLHGGACGSYDLQPNNVGPLLGYMAAITAFGTASLEVETGFGQPPGVQNPFNTTPQYTSAGTGQFSLSVGTVTSLTVPQGATLAEICVENYGVRYRDDGTSPTSSSGIPVASGNCYQFSGPSLLANVKFIAQTGSPTIDVSYYK